MYIQNGHFLSPYLLVLRDGKSCSRLVSVDTDLMIGVRLVGFDPETGEQLTDLVKIDKVMFVNLPEGLRDLIPDGFEIVKTSEEEAEGK